jgi:hypothetical protein
VASGERQQLFSRFCPSAKRMIGITRSGGYLGVSRRAAGDELAVVSPDRLRDGTAEPARISSAVGEDARSGEHRRQGMYGFDIVAEPLGESAPGVVLEPGLSEAAPVSGKALERRGGLPEVM